MSSTETTTDGTAAAPLAAQWRQVELTLRGPATPRPYVDVDGWVEFTHSSGERLRRPMFFDGGTTWRVRFSSTRGDGTWQWASQADNPEHRFTPAAGTLISRPAPPGPAHPALTHGLPRAAEGHRTFCYADGSPLFLVVDTAWALPWRATVDDVAVYAADRRSKGFNAVLLMSVQPDLNTRGPEGRNIDEGFEVGFRDLPRGRLTDINIDYFRYFDRIVEVLIGHGLTPILQPVFQGFGWKGKPVAGSVVPPTEYARYCRYLVARFGARPAIYLPGADGVGSEPQTEAGGQEIHAWDDYAQPTGIHYQPHTRANKHQDADWLDFQSCQTGHMGDHVPDRVATIWAQQPAKAVINAEPTYEHTGRRGVGEGWWQGHEAWSNVCAGATMGVGYGAASLWQWRLHRQEPGHEPYFLAADAGWREALGFEGGHYVGLVGKILDGLPLARAEPCWDVSTNTRGLLDPTVVYVGYAEHGGPWTFLDGEGRVPSRYWMVDPRSGAVLKSGATPPNGVAIENPSYHPSVLICCETPPPIATSPATGRDRVPRWGNRHRINIRDLGEESGR